MPYVFISMMISLIAFLWIQNNSKYSVLLPRAVIEQAEKQLMDESIVKWLRRALDCETTLQIDQVDCDTDENINLIREVNTNTNPALAGVAADLLQNASTRIVNCDTSTGVTTQFILSSTEIDFNSETVEINLLDDPRLFCSGLPTGSVNLVWPDPPTLIGVPTGGHMEAAPNIAWNTVDNTNHYEYGVSENNNLTDAEITGGWHDIGSVTDYTAEFPDPPGILATTLTSGTDYYSKVRAHRGTPLPNHPGNVAVSAAWQITDALVITQASSGSSASEAPVASWNSIPGAARYEYAIGTTSGGTDVTGGWHDIGIVTTYTAQNPGIITAPLVSGTQYYTTVRALDGASVEMTAAVGPNWAIDFPQFTGEPVRFNSTTAAPELHWNAVVNAVRYDVAVGHTPGGTEKVVWKNVGNVTSTTITTDQNNDPVTFESGAKFYPSVRAVNGNDVPGNPWQGAGWENLLCPPGYIKVPGNTTPNLGGPSYTNGTNTFDDWSLGHSHERPVADFCVMKYEAKAGITSTPTGLPTVNIARDTAISNCMGLGTGFFLMNNSHWQAIAHSIETNAINRGGGGDWFNVGNSYIAGTHTPLEASANDAEGCFNITVDHLQSAGDTVPAIDCGGVWNLVKRTHTLSNGEVIWDFAGNVWEMVWDDHTSEDLDTSGSFYEMASSSAYNGVDPPLHKLAYGPFNPFVNFLDAAGLGVNYGTASIDPSYRVERGGGSEIAEQDNLAQQNYPGMLTTRVTNLGTAEVYDVGYRCVYAPCDPFGAETAACLP